MRSQFIVISLALAPEDKATFDEMCGELKQSRPQVLRRALRSLRREMGGERL